MAWNEKASNELKKLNLTSKPNAKQKARITELKGLKANKGMTTAPAGPGDQGFSGTYTEDPNMTANQNAIQYGIEQGDLGVLGTANDQLAGVDAAYSTPYNYTGPGQATANPEERARIEKQLFDQFEARNAPVQQQENEDLQRWANATGNGPGTPQYAARSQQLSQAQNDRRQAAQTEAAALGGQEYQRSFDLQDRAFNTGVGQYETQRDRPLQEYAGLRGAVAGVSPAQEFGYQTRLQDQQGNISNRNNLASIRAQKASTGGGGRSGGTGRGRGMTQAPANYSVVPGIQQPSLQQDSSGGLFGSLLGPVAGGVGQGIGKWIGSLF